MQPIQVESHQLPPPNVNSAPSTTGKRISFARFIAPFVNLLDLIGTTIISAFRAVIDCSYRAASIVSFVFYRLVFEPVFNPLDPSFKTVTLANFENKVPAFQTRLDQMEQKFKHNHRFNSAVQDLQCLNAEIGELHQTLQTYLNILNSHKVQVAVKEDVVRIEASYKELNQRINLFLLFDGENLINRFEGFLAIFFKNGMHPRESIRKDLIQTWKGLYACFSDRLDALNTPDLAIILKEKLAGLKKRMELLEAPADDRDSLIHPLNLKNVGNSCYLDSVLECIACCHPVCDQITTPIIRDPKEQDEYQKKLAIQQELLQFVRPKQIIGGADASEMEYILWLLGGPSNERLRREIFESKFHPTLQGGADEIEGQQDAADALQMLIERFLPSSICKIKKFKCSPVFEGFVFTGNDTEALVQIGWEPEVKELHKKSGLGLIQLIKANMNSRLEQANHILDPKAKNAVVVDDAKAIASRDKPAQNVSEYYQTTRFEELPPVFALQLKRHIYDKVKRRPAKDDVDVNLPQSGIVDLKDYALSSAYEGKNTKYKIKSYVAHYGSSMSSGHYVACVEIKGKYYECDDLKGYKEISKRDFLKRKDAYLVFLERLPDDEPQTGG